MANISIIEALKKSAEAGKKYTDTKVDYQTGLISNIRTEVDEGWDSQINYIPNMVRSKTTGELVGSNGRCCSEFISVQEDHEYQFYCNDSYTPIVYIVWFDENKNLTRVIEDAISSPYGRYPITSRTWFKALAGEKYCVIQDTIPTESNVGRFYINHRSADEPSSLYWKAEIPTHHNGLKDKQDKLIAGQNIVIGADGKTISATGSSVVMTDNADGGVDLTVDGTTKTLAKESDLSSLIGFPKVIYKTGLLVNLPGVSTEPIMGYGNAIVTLYANNICSVDFDVKIYAKDGTQTSSFAWGLNGLLLSDEYIITPTTRQGIVKYFNPDGTVDESHEGYAGWAGASGNCWTFGRVHKIAGDTGSWPVSSIPVNERINGRVYGTWTKV